MVVEVEVADVFVIKFDQIEEALVVAKGLGIIVLVVLVMMA